LTRREEERGEEEERKELPWGGAREEEAKRWTRRYAEPAAGFLGTGAGR
jgi:hypothetical protein